MVRSDRHERNYFLGWLPLSFSSACAAILAYALTRDVVRLGLPSGKVAAFCVLCLVTLMFASMTTYRVTAYATHWKLKYLVFTLAKVSYGETNAIHDSSFRFFRGYLVFREPGRGSQSFFVFRLRHERELIETIFAKNPECMVDPKLSLRIGLKTTLAEATRKRM